jgi:hypothetical protein
MTELEKYHAVNKCKTLDELADVILSFADEDGNIQGRSGSFSAELMAGVCLGYNLKYHNSLTREFGIRQQAMMIIFYNK